MRRLKHKQLLGAQASQAKGSLLAPALILKGRAPAISLDSQFEEKEVEGKKVREVPRFKWLHVASEGSFKGHADGEFDLTREVFEQFVKNLRADPRYKAGEDGVGTEKVIPFDFEHASELDPTSGSIPVTGVPAPAWALDFDVRDGADGKAQLWAYTDLLQNPATGGPSLIREYIASDGYRHVSIAFSLESTDPSDASNIGARISSIAFTNHPFLRDLAPIAARRRDLEPSPELLAQGREVRTLYWYDPAGTPEQGMQYTRQCLGLPATSDANAVKAEIAKIAAFAANPATIPPGVDIDDIFSGLRKIWSLPVTATVAEITAEIDKAAAMVVAAQTTTPAPVPVPAPAAPATEAAASGKDEKVKTMSFLQRTAKKLRKVNPDLVALDDEAAAEAAVDVAIDSHAQLSAILNALNKSSAAEALKAIPELLAAKSEMEAALAQLDEVLQMQTAVDAEAAVADVEAAASEKGLGTDPAVVNALTMYRNSLVNAEIAKLSDKDKKSAKRLSEARTAGRKAFLSEYGVAPKGMELLLRNHVAAPGGRQLKAPKLERDGEPVRDAGEVETIDLSSVPGANRSQKLINYAKTEKKLNNDQAYDFAKRANRRAAEGLLIINDDTAAN